MKTFIYLVCISIMSFQAYAQDPMLQNPDRELDEQAKELTFKYNKELGLTADQIGPFEIKIEEFLIRREKIEETLSGGEKLKALYKLQKQETLEMQNVLTRPQLTIYKQVKPKIQPLDVVEEEDE